MRIISRKLHAMLDYMFGLLLISSPWLFDFEGIFEAKWIAIILGIIMLLMAIITDYEGGITKMFTMASNLNLDVAAGIFLAASPWIFGFSEQVYLPHLIIGIIALVTALFTQRKSEHPKFRHLDDVKQAHYSYKPSRLTH